MNITEAKLFKDWWLLSLKGVLAIILGGFVIAEPEKAIVFINRYLGILILINGSLILYHSIQNRKLKVSWRYWILEGIFDIIIGAYMIWKPMEFFNYIFIVISIWILSVGIIQMTTALKLKSQFQNWWTILLMGLILCVLALVILLDPIASSIYIAIIIGIFTVIAGLLIFFVARQLVQ